MACGDPKARFAAVLLDPDLLASVPRRVAAMAGMDALSHALESFVSTARTPASVSLARRAFALLEPTVEAMASPPATPSVRARALVGAHLAGAAIERSMLGAAHAAANPLTARHGVPHGEAIALVLPAVVRFNADVVGELYRDLWPGGGSDLAARIEVLRAACGLPVTLDEAGAGGADAAELAALAAEEWTGGFNPRPADREAFEEVYAGLL
jgi:alcohol dehydrogenase